MDELRKLTSEYLSIEDKCDGTAETFADLYPLVVDLEKKVKDLKCKSRSRETWYFASKLFQDVKEMERRFWKYTV